MNKDTTTAFPSKIYDFNSEGQVVRESYHGMDLRDYFAAKALQGIVWGYTEGSSKHADSVANEAYAFADAMMAARLK